MGILTLEIANAVMKYLLTVTFTDFNHGPVGSNTIPRGVQ